jgi:hypothetical protein
MSPCHISVHEALDDQLRNVIVAGQIECPRQGTTQMVPAAVRVRIPGRTRRARRTMLAARVLVSAPTPRVAGEPTLAPAHILVADGVATPYSAPGACGATTPAWTRMPSLAGGPARER